MPGACLLVPMVGGPLAVPSLLPIAIAITIPGAWVAGDSPAHAVNALAWNGVLPATFALGLGLATRRWLPQHRFVYVPGRGFIVTATCVAFRPEGLASWPGRRYLRRA